jgi:hypothetical protein
MKRSRRLWDSVKRLGRSFGEGQGGYPLGYVQIKL